MNKHPTHLFSTHTIEKEILNEPTPISFDGNIYIENNVSKSTVCAKGHMWVNGWLEQATLRSEKGSLFILFGSSEECDLKAALNVFVKHGSHSTLQAGQDVVVENSLLHCSVRAGGKVISESRQGKVIGGSIQAGSLVLVDTIGSQRHIPTEVKVENPKGFIACETVYPDTLLKIGNASFKVKQTIKASLFHVVDNQIVFRELNKQRLSEAEARVNKTQQKN